MFFPCKYGGFLSIKRTLCLSLWIEKDWIAQQDNFFQHAIKTGSHLQYFTVPIKTHSRFE